MVNEFSFDIDKVDIANVMLMMARYVAKTIKESYLRPNVAIDPKVTTRFLGKWVRKNRIEHKVTNISSCWKKIGMISTQMWL
jgi:hypothetical protein